MRLKELNREKDIALDLIKMAFSHYEKSNGTLEKSQREVVRLYWAMRRGVRVNHFVDSSCPNQSELTDTPVSD